MPHTAFSTLVLCLGCVLQCGCLESREYDLSATPPFAQFDGKAAVLTRPVYLAESKTAPFFVLRYSEPMQVYGGDISPEPKLTLIPAGQDVVIEGTQFYYERTGEGIEAADIRSRVRLILHDQAGAREVAAIFSYGTEHGPLEIWSYLSPADFR